MKHQKPPSPKSVLIILLIFAGMNITAQEETTKKVSAGDHIFTPISYSALPSTNTYINTTAALGQTINLFHSITINEDLGVIGLSGEVAFVDLYFAYQQRIRDWLAAYIQLGMSARLGTELQSILVQGFNTITHFTIGWQFKILEGDKFAFAAVFKRGGVALVEVVPVEIGQIF